MPRKIKTLHERNVAMFNKKSYPKQVKYLVDLLDGLLDRAGPRLSLDEERFYNSVINAFRDTDNPEFKQKVLPLNKVQHLSARQAHIHTTALSKK